MGLQFISLPMVGVRNLAVSHDPRYGLPQPGAPYGADGDPRYATPDARPSGPRMANEIHGNGISEAARPDATALFRTGGRYDFAL